MSLPPELAAAPLYEMLQNAPWKDIAPWIGIAASLGFNLFNYSRGNAAKRNAHRLDELKSMRSSVEVVFDEIGDQLYKVGALDVAQFDKDSHLEVIRSANKQLAELYIKAQDRLSRLDARAVSFYADA